MLTYSSSRRRPRAGAQSSGNCHKPPPRRPRQPLDYPPQAEARKDNGRQDDAPQQDNGTQQDDGAQQDARPRQDDSEDSHSRVQEDGGRGGRSRGREGAGRGGAGRGGAGRGGGNRPNADPCLRFDPNELSLEDSNDDSDNEEVGATYNPPPHDSLSDESDNSSHDDDATAPPPQASEFAMAQVVSSMRLNDCACPRISQSMGRKLEDSRIGMTVRELVEQWRTVDRIPDVLELVAHYGKLPVLDDDAILYGPWRAVLGGIRGLDEEDSEPDRIKMSLENFCLLARDGSVRLHECTISMRCSSPHSHSLPIVTASISFTVRTSQGRYRKTGGCA